MKIGFVIYNGMTSLDFIGIYDPISRLKTMKFVNDFEYDVCAFIDSVTSAEGLKIMPDKIRTQLSEYDYIIIPGGDGILNLVKDNQFLDWLKTSSGSKKICAICGGSLLLGIIGKLKGKKATTHPNLMEFLKKFTDQTSTDRIVGDFDIITAGGVTSSIDLGLYLCEKIAGEQIRKQIQSQMDYLNYNIK